MKAVVAAFNRDYEPSDGPFWSITNDPGLRLTQCSYKIDEDSPSNIFPAQFVSYAVCGVITDLISYALTQQYETKHKKTMDHLHTAEDDRQKSDLFPS